MHSQLHVKPKILSLSHITHIVPNERGRVFVKVYVWFCLYSYIPKRRAEIIRMIIKKFCFT